MYLDSRSIERARWPSSYPATWDKTGLGLGSVHACIRAHTVRDQGLGPSLDNIDQVLRDPFRPTQRQRDRQTEATN